MPRQNRPLVRDGRIQPKKKRTDRRYLGGSAKPEEAGNAESLDTAAPDVDSPEAPDVAPEPVAAAPASPPQPAVRSASNKLPTTVRALQQQGVRKRRELDVDALAERDTRYAIHELRRILILTTLVIATLIVLAFVLR